ncbi:hypothetical protein ACTMTU_02110 [Streptomyces sp. OZ13]|uniref:hypothetical protein n=1 Tax=Streptomyces sp. OZ13 TaxID=3452210 RepID=UPI003F8ADE5E
MTRHSRPGPEPTPRPEGLGAGMTADLAADLDAGPVEETRRSAGARNDPFSPESEALVCERILGDRRHGL